MDLIYRCRFKKSNSLLFKAFKIAKKIIVSEEVKPVDSADTKSAFDEQDATQQVEMKLSYSYTTSDESAKSKLTDTIKSVFLKYTK
jgi:hypothetical protein